MARTAEEIRAEIRHKADENTSPYFGWLWRLLGDDVLSAGEKLTGVAVWAHGGVNSDGTMKTPRPPVSRIMAITRRDERTVFRDTKKIAVRGLWEKTPGKGKVATHYRLTIERCAEELGKIMDARGDTHDTSGGDTHDTQTVHSNGPSNGTYTEPVLPAYPNTHSRSRELFSDGRRLAERMREIDRNIFLNRRLFCENGYAELSDLMALYGAERCEAEMRAVLTEPGSELRRGQIGTWRFFIKRLRREYADLQDVEKAAG